MSYRVFKKKVFAIIRKAGGDIDVRFAQDREHGKFYANCSDGVVIIGNSGCLKVSVRWGDRHYGIAEI